MYGGSLANYVANADLFQNYVSDQDQYLMDAYKNTRSYCTNYTIDGSVLLVNTDMLKEMGIEFCDDLGMFRIKHRSNTGRGKMNELFRYDQVASYEEYIDETPASEPGKNPEFKECGLKIKLLGGNMSKVNTDNKKGLRPHPYIKQELKICFSKNNRSDAQYAHNAKCKFDYIFGVHDDERGLFGFGRSKAEKREDAAAIGMAAAFGTAFKAATKGEEAITETDKEKLKEGINAMNDAATGGMAVYTRRADDAEAKIK